MSDMILVRHGQASFGADNYDKLSRLGETQARICGDHFAEVRESFTAVYSGQLERQLNTAALIQSSLLKQGLDCPQPVQDAGFNEYDSRALFESLLSDLLKEEPELVRTFERVRTDRKAFQILIEKVMKRWISGKFDRDHLPRWQDFKENLRKTIAYIMAEHSSKQTILVSTSGGPIAAVIQIALELSDDMALDVTWQIYNASITRFKFNQDRLTLTGFNDINHLKRTNDSSLLTFR